MTLLLEIFLSLSLHYMEQIQPPLCGFGNAVHGFSMSACSGVGASKIHYGNGTSRIESMLFNVESDVVTMMMTTQVILLWLAKDLQIVPFPNDLTDHMHARKL